MWENMWVWWWQELPTSQGNIPLLISPLNLPGTTWMARFGSPPGLSNLQLASSILKLSILVARSLPQRLSRHDFLQWLVQMLPVPAWQVADFSELYSSHDVEFLEVDSEENLTNPDPRSLIRSPEAVKAVATPTKIPEKCGTNLSWLRLQEFGYMFTLARQFREVFTLVFRCFQYISVLNGVLTWN